MRCHYDVLEVALIANADAIKKSYRKLALKWHPDKNVNNFEEATEKFKEISTAYAVLSDPHEKKWYDDHRESILRGGDSEEDAADDNLWPFFNASCFHGYGEDEESFYAVYSKLFSDIDKREQDYNIRVNSSSGRSISRAPVLGSASSTEREVQQYYDYWQNFVTALSFGSEDRYNTCEDGITRYVRRQMEKENKKIREVARKKYTETVRALAAFTKKCDERVKRFDQEAKQRKAAEKERQQTARLQQIEERKAIREQNAKTYKELEEQEDRRKEEERSRSYLLAENSDDENDFYGGEAAGDAAVIEGKDLEECEEGGSVNSEQVQEEQQEEPLAHVVQKGEDWYHCELCKKDFKSESQLLQHVQSKVHKKKVQEFEKRQANSNKSNGKRNAKNGKTAKSATKSTSSVTSSVAEATSVFTRLSVDGSCSEDSDEEHVIESVFKGVATCSSTAEDVMDRECDIGVLSQSRNSKPSRPPQSVLYMSSSDEDSD